MAEQLRAALYGRVSSEEQVEGYSLDAQRRAFRTWWRAADGPATKSIWRKAARLTPTTFAKGRSSKKP